jgi:hypothetical protein
MEFQMHDVTTHCFTGQPYVGYEKVNCPVCSKHITVREGWYDRYNDPYNRGGSYVCRGCLSDKRKSEIKQELYDNLPSQAIIWHGPLHGYVTDNYGTLVLLTDEQYASFPHGV